MIKTIVYTFALFLFSSCGKNAGEAVSSKKNLNENNDEFVFYTQQSLGISNWEKDDFSDLPKIEVKYNFFNFCVSEAKSKSERYIEFARKIIAGPTGNDPETECRAIEKFAKTKKKVSCCVFSFG